MKKSDKKKRSLLGALPAVPYVVWMVLFIAIPLGMVAFFALTDPQGQFTLENIARGGEHMSVLLRSIKLAAIATILCIIIAYPLAYILSRKQGFQKQTLFVMVMLPMWMNFLLRTFAWMTILENNGLINKFLGLFGIGPLQMINTQGAVILGMVYNYIQKSHDQPDIQRRKPSAFSHKILPSISSSSKLLIMLMHSRTTTISTSEMAEPRFGL